MILPSTYLGNIELFYYLAINESVIIDHAELYQKQTFRSRTSILSANGVQTLSIPVERPFGKATRMFEAKISQAENWQKNHIKSIESAYRRTPFYEYYSDEIFEILSHDYEFLIDINRSLINHISDKLGILCKIEYSQIDLPFVEDDLRKKLSPKIESRFSTHRYIQTFEEKFGFQNNLSILDLLFNEGPNSICIIEESILKNS